MIILFLTARGK